MDIEASYNFRRITEKLTTSGIVQPDGLKALRAQGYEVVINLLPDTGRNAIPNERDIVESQGIEYIYIPVDFKQPTSADFPAHNLSSSNNGNPKLARSRSRNESANTSAAFLKNRITLGRRPQRKLPNIC